MAKRKSNPLGVDGEVLALSLLTVGEAAHGFSSYMPSRFTIKNWVLDGNEAEVDKKISDLRSGYTPSLVIALGLGGIVSYIAKSPLPLLFAAGTSIAMTVLYEQALPSHKQLHHHVMRRCGILENVPLTITPIDGVVDLMASEWWIA